MLELDLEIDTATADQIRQQFGSVRVEKIAWNAPSTFFRVLVWGRYVGVLGVPRPKSMPYSAAAVTVASGQPSTSQHRSILDAIGWMVRRSAN